MIFIEKKDIDFLKWDASVTNSVVENPTCYSWYLNASCENWGAIISEDYSFLLPFSTNKRLGQKRIVHHSYIRQVDAFGDITQLKNALLLLKDFDYVDLSISEQNNTNYISKTYQSIQYSEGYKYKTNAQRILKKVNGKYSFKISNDYHSILTFYRGNSFNKIKQNPKNLDYLGNIMSEAIKRGKGECIIAYEDNKVIGGEFIIKDKNTATYLIGDCNSYHKKEGLMYALLDFAINHYKDNYQVFDFGGSNIKSVAQFYKKLGGTDKYYSNILIDNMPWWFKLLKKLKRE